jgi:AcrR family transcriptional regulator
MTNEPTKNHHHGDLREALIVSGIGLLSEGGLIALTLRKCAARAGVSHAAPAHHFSGLQGLKQAIAERGIRLFADAMQREIDGAKKEPFEKLNAMCKGYLNFYQQNQALANLMFNQNSGDISPSLEGRSNNPAFKILVDACSPFKHPESGPLATQYAVWSLIQGYAQLLSLGQIKQPIGQKPILFEDLLNALNLQIRDQ